MPHINPWFLWAATVVALLLAWGLFAWLDEALRGIRWRVHCWRYWRKHPLGPVEQWETERNV